MIGVEEMCTEVKARCTLLLSRYVCMNYIVHLRYTLCTVCVCAVWGMWGRVHVHLCYCESCTGVHKRCNDCEWKR